MRHAQPISSRSACEHSFPALRQTASLVDQHDVVELCLDQLHPRERCCISHSQAQDLVSSGLGERKGNRASPSSRVNSERSASCPYRAEFNGVLVDAILHFSTYLELKAEQCHSKMVTICAPQHLIAPALAQPPPNAREWAPRRSRQGSCSVRD